jgi:Dolichyl-phosphate-mannose-protein mannosyltransferase
MAVARMHSNIRTIFQAYGWQCGLVGLIALFLVQCIGFALQNGPTFDEPLEYDTGVEYLFTGDLEREKEHTPLPKFLGATSQLVWSWATHQPMLLSVENRIPLPARLPGMVHGVLILVTVALWVRRLCGITPSLLVTFLGATDPTFVAHASLLTPDIAVTCWVFVGTYLAWQYTSRPSLKNYLAAGCAIALALLSKFTAIPLLVFSALCTLLLYRSHLPITGESRVPTLLNVLWIFLGWMVVSVVFIVIFYGGQVSVFWSGLWSQIIHAQEGHKAFLLGQVSEFGWPHYFFVAYIIKTPLPMLVCLALGIASLRWSLRKTPWLYCVLLPVLFLGVLMISRINIGVRYLLPAYPFFWCLAGLGIKTLSAKWSKRAGLMLTILVLAQCASVAPVFPHYLAYANELFGGPSRLPFYLSDSNIDWGQDLYRLPAYMQTHGVRDIRLASFSYLQPTRYGMRIQVLPACLPTYDRSELATDIPQLLAISVSVLNGACSGNVGQYAWLRQRQPTSILGYSIYIYDITHDADAHRQLALLYQQAGNSMLSEYEISKAEEIEARGL